MSNPTTIQAAKAYASTLKTVGFHPTVEDVPKTDYLAKISLGNLGKICVYTKANGMSSVRLHEMKSKEAKAELEKLFESPTKTQCYEKTEHLLAYVDGSGLNGECGFGILLVKNGKVLQEISGNLGPSKNSQIGGEVEATIHALDYALTHKEPKIEIRFDYEGVQNWSEGKWQANDTDALRLKHWAYFALMETGLDIKFTHTKAHTGEPGNERADQLAKEGTKKPAQERLKSPIDPDATILNHKPMSWVHAKGRHQTPKSPDMD